MNIDLKSQYGKVRLLTFSKVKIIEDFFDFSLDKRNIEAVYYELQPNYPFSKIH